MTGIKESKELLTFTARLVSAIKGALADGQIGFTDIEELFGPIMAAKAAFENTNLIPGEIADLDDYEAAELTGVFAREFNLNGSNVEVLSEKGLALALALVAYVNEVRGATA